MICNVCGEDKRVYILTELISMPLPEVYRGLLFKICTDCLSKLIKLIATEKTQLENPAGITVRSMFIDRLEKAEERRPPLPSPIKVNKDE